MKRRYLLSALTLAAIVLAIVCVHPWNRRAVSPAVGWDARVLVPHRRAPAARVDLSRRIAEVHFDGITFADAVEKVRRQTGLNIVAEWRTLEAAGIESTATVHLSLRDVSLETLLRSLLDQVGGGNVRLAWFIQDTIVLLTTQEQEWRFAETRVYDVRDIVLDVLQFRRKTAAAETQPAVLGATNATVSGGPQGGNRPRRGGRAGGRARSSGGLFLFDVDNKLDTEYSVAVLIEQCVTDIEPDGWMVNGGRLGSVEYFAGRLIVRTAPRNLDKIEELLAGLRGQR
ncbi:MAG: hypothetical protein ACHRHE_20650 [Tepidisphaerales bacterium]